MKDIDKVVRGSIILLLIMAVVVLVLMATACNYQVVDLQYSFDYAYIKLPNGDIIEGHVDNWRDYEDGEQIQVTIGGVTYLTNSYNCTLVSY